LLSTIAVKDLKENPEYLALTPRPSKEEYEALKQDIKQNGVKIPLLVNKDKEIVDGYTRYQIAKELGIEKLPVMVESFVDKNQEKYATICLNLHRRHYNIAQKAEQVLKLLEIEREKAKQRQKATLPKKGEKGFRQVNVDPSEVRTLKGRAVEIVAKKVGISHNTLRKAEKIKEKAKEDPEIKKEWEKALKGKKSLNQVYKKVMRKIKKESVGKSPPLPCEKFDVILADPPWKYEVDYLSASPDNHYPTMTVEEICSLKVPASENAVLFLWTTNPMLENALEVMKSWGFQYKTNLVWVKDKLGLGFYFRGQHELLLVGVKGKARPPQESRRFSSVLHAAVRNHSEKPDKVYEIIEKMYPDSKKVELFARKKRKGWTAWGLEVA